MSTVNGCGTLFYGWRGLSTNKPAATKWLVLFYLPLFPLARYRLTPTTDFAREKFAKSAAEIAAALVGYGSRTDAYTIHAKEPIAFLEVLSTYVKAYVALPFLIVWPLLALYLLRLLFGVHPEWENQAWFTPALTVFALITVVNAVVVPMWAIQSARGYSGGFFRRKS